MNDIKVSVIVPIYNVEHFLKCCLESLKQQTLDGLEVWLVNDGSTDQSGIIAREYAKQAPAFFHYLEKQNGGLSDARNYALPYVSGEYIAFLDSDDYVAPDMYELLWKKAKEGDFDLVDCEFEFVYDDGSKSRSVAFHESKDLLEYMIFAYPNAWNKLYKTAWIKKIGATFPKGLWHEDIDFFYQIIPFVNKLPATIHKPLYFYRQRSGSIMKTADRRILDIHKIYASLFAYYRECGLIDKYKDLLEYKYLKTNFSSFLVRMLKISDKKFRSDIIDESWMLFNKACPNWRKNPYLKQKSLRNVFLKSLNPLSLKILKMLAFCLS